MDVAISRAHRSLRRAHISTGGIEGRLAKCQPSSLIADERRKDISLAQRKAHRNTEGFLPSTEKNPSMNFAGAVKVGELVVQRSRQKHQLKCADESISRSGGFRPASNLRLNHAQ